MHNLVRAAAMLATAALFAGEGSAKVLATATRASNYTSTATTATAVPLTSGGATSLSFSTSSSNTLVTVTYNAECGAIGSSPSSYTVVKVLVDGVEAAPASSTGFAFCSAAGGASTYAWVGATRKSVISVPNAGAHSVQIQAQVIGGATTLWLGDTSLVVKDESVSGIPTVRPRGLVSPYGLQYSHSADVFGPWRGTQLEG